MPVANPDPSTVIALFAQIYIIIIKMSFSHNKLDIIQIIIKVSTIFYFQTCRYENSL